MKTPFPMLALALSVALAAAQETKLEKPDLAKIIAGWGETIDPDGDCKFALAGKKLTLTVPGTDRPHDLSVELGSTNAPRVLQPVAGNFVIEVKIEGTFLPGGISTQPGRTGYNGAGLLLMADPKNYVRLECATLQRGGGDPEPYTNFEIRVDGDAVRLGSTADRPLKFGQPVWLRLERRDGQILGAVSDDGVKWDDLPPKEVPPEWCHELNVGVTAISTSKFPFAPVYSGLKLEHTNSGKAK